MAARAGIGRNRWRRVRSLLAAAIGPVVGMSLAPAARAETKVFSETGSLWSDALNWTPVGVPASGDDVVIAGGTVDMILDFDLTLRKLSSSASYDLDPRRKLTTFSTGNATISLSNVPGSGVGVPTFIAVTGGTFTIGDVVASGVTTGRVGLEILNSGAFSTSAGSTLIINGSISESGGSHDVEFIGGGTVILGGENTYSGVTTVGHDLKGELKEARMENLGRLSNTSGVQINAGGLLTLDNSAMIVNDRLNDAAPIELAGGTIRLIGGASAVTEDFGQVSLSKHGVISVVPAGNASVGPPTARFAGITRDATSTLDVQLGSGSTVRFTSPPVLSDGVLTWATVNGEDWATLNASNDVVAYAAYQTGGPSLWAASDNVLVDGAAPALISTDRMVNTLKLAGSSSLTIESGATLHTDGILVGSNSGDSGSISGGGSLTAKAAAAMAVNVGVSTTTALTISNSIVDNGASVSLVKAGIGTLVLDGTNTFTGPAIVNQGTLELHGLQPVGGNILIHADSTLRLADGADLAASHGIQIGQGTVAIEVESGAAATLQGSLSDAFGNSAGAETVKTGGGTLALYGTSSFTGSLSVRGQDGSNLLLGKSEGRLTSLSSVSIHTGATLTLDSTDAIHDDRINDAADINMHGGTLQLFGFEDPLTPTSETLGNLNLNSGSNTIRTMQLSPPVGHNPLNRPAYINFTCEFLNGRSATSRYELRPGGHITFSSPQPLVNGIIGPHAIVTDANGQSDWATLDATGEVVAYTAYHTDPNPANWAATDNVAIEESVAITANTTVNTLKIQNSTGAFSERDILLDVARVFATGGILADGLDDSISGPGFLTARTGSGELFVHVTDSLGNFTISAPIVDNGSPVSLVTSGAGTIILNSASTHTGRTYINGDKAQAAQFASLIDSIVQMSDSALLEVMPGPAPFEVGGLEGGGEIQLARGIVVTKPGTGGTSFSGRITGAGSFTTIGDGTLTLSGENSYTGETVIDGGTVVLDGNGSLASTSNVTLTGNRPRMTIAITEGANRINDAAPIEMHGGKIKVSFGAGLPTTDFEAVGLLKIVSGANTIETSGGGLQFSSLTRDNGGNNVNWLFQGGGSLRFVTPPTLSNGIMGAWATANDTDWATIDGTGAVAAYAGYNVDADPDTWTTNQNVRLTGSPPLIDGAAPVIVNTLNLQPLGGPIVIHIDAQLQTNGILLSGADGAIEGGGSLTAKTANSSVVVITSGLARMLTISTPVTDNDSSVSLVKAGAGTLVLNAASTHTGTTYINEGKVEAAQFANLIDSMINMQEDAVLQVMPGDNPFSIGGLTGGGEIQLARGIITVKSSGSTGAAYSGRITGIGSFTAIGDGTLTLTGVNTYSGETIVSGGTLELSGAGDLTNTPTITVKQGGLFRFKLFNEFATGAAVEMQGGTIAAVLNGNVVIGDLRISTGANSVTQAFSADASGTYALRAASLSHTAGASVDFEVGNDASVVLTTPPSLSNGIIGAYATVNGSDWATVDGTGNVVAFTNYWTDQNPATWDAARNVGIDQDCDITADITVNTLKFKVGSTIPHQIRLFDCTLSLDGILATNDGDSITGNGELTAKKNPYVIIRTNDQGSRMTIATPIVDNSDEVGIVKSGEGTLVLDADNSYSGATFVNEGTLEFGAGGKSVNSSVYIHNSGSVEINQAKEFAGLAGEAGSALNLNAAALTVGANNVSTTFAGVISGAAGSLIKRGDGTLSLTGDNTYTGLTTVAEGTLHLQKLGGDILIHDDAALRVGDGTTLVGSKDIVVVVPGADFKLGGGIKRWRPAVIDVASDTILKTGNVGINEALPDTGLHKRGPGRLELAASSDYSGATIVSAGEFYLSGSNASLPNTSALIVAGAGNPVFIWRDDGDLGFIADRVKNSAPIIMDGGMIEFASADPTATEQLGELHLSGPGNRYVALMQNRLNRLQQDHPHATIDFQSSGAGEVVFENTPTLVHGIIGPWATFTDPVTGVSDFATVQPAPGGGRVWPTAGYFTGAESSWDGTKNVSIDGDVTLSASRDANTLKVNQPPTGGQCIVTVSSGLELRTNSVLATGDVLFTGGGAILPHSGNSLFLHTAASGNINIAFNLKDSTSDPTDVMITGPGTVTLSGDNTYTGATKVSRSVLKTFFETGDKPTQSQFHMSGGATLDISAHDQTIGSLSGDGKVILGGSTLIVGLNNLSSTFDGEFIGTAGADGGGGGGITKIGTGTLTLRGGMNSPGAMQVQNGRVRINDLEERLKALGLLSSVRLGSSTTHGAIEFDVSDDSVIDIPIILEAGGGTIGTASDIILTGGTSGSGSVMFNPKEYTITKSTPWTHHKIQSLSAMTHSGQTTIDGVNLTLAGGGSLQNTTAVTLRNGATLVFVSGSVGPVSNIINDDADLHLNGSNVRAIQNGNVPTSERMRVVTVQGYDNTIAALPHDASLAHELRFTSAQFAGGMVNFVSEGNGRIYFDSPPALINGILDPGARFNGADWATVDGTGKVVAYSGYQTNPDPLSWTTSDNVSIDSDITISQDTEVNTLRRAPAAVPRAAGLVNGVTLATNGILAANDGDSITGDGKVTGNVDSLRVITHRDSGFTMAVPIVNNGGGAVKLLKGGEGTLLLTADNTHTGNTIIGGGVLELAAGARLSTSVVDISRDGALVVNGDSTIGGLKGLGKASYGGMVGIGHPSFADTFGGEISGPGGINITAGTLTLTGENSYTGETVIDGGALVLDGNGSLANTSKVTLQGKRMTIAVTEITRDGASRINPQADIVMRGGALVVDLASDASDDPPATSLGAVILQSGANTLQTSSTLTLASLAKGGGGTLGSGTTCQIPCNTGYGRVLIQQPVPLTNGIFGAWATTTDTAGITDWATGDGAIFNGTQWQEVAHYQDYETSTDPLDWQSTDNVLVTAPVSAPVVVNDPVQAHTYKLQSGFIYATQPGSGRVAGILTTGVGDSGILGEGKMTAPAGTNVLVVHAHGTGGNFRMGLPIVDNDAPLSVVKTGPQTLALEAINTFSGELEIQQGEVRLSSAGQIRKVIVRGWDSGKLNLNNTDQTISGLTGAGEVLLGTGSLTIDQSTSTTFAGAITGAGKFELRGSGTTPLAGLLKLTGVSTFSGATVVDGGTLVLDEDGSLTNTSMLHVSGGASVIIKPPNNVPHPTAGGPYLRIASTALIEMSGGTLDLQGGASPGTIPVGLMKVKEKGNRTKCSSNLRLISAGLQHEPGGGTIDFEIAAGGGVSFTSPPALTHGIIGPWATVNGSDWARVDSAGHVGHFGDYVATDDPAAWTGEDNIYLGEAAPDLIQISVDVETNTFKQDFGPVQGTRHRTMMLSNGATLATDGILNAGSHSISGDGFLKSRSGNLIVLHDRDSNDALIISAEVADEDNAPGCELIKTGPGTVILDARASYTGTTHINEGTLKLTANVRGIHAADLDRDGKLDIALADQSIGSLSGGGEVWLGGKKLYVGNLPFNTVYGGDISGSGDLHKIGDGSLTLTGANTLTGSVTVSGGYLDLLDNGALPDISALKIDAGGTMTQKAPKIDLNPRIAATAPITLDGGTLLFESEFGSVVSQPLGILNLEGGANRTGFKASKITFGGGTTRINHATINFDVTDGGAVAFASPPSLTNGIVGPWATVNDSDWATIAPDGSVVAYTGYSSDSNPASWTPTQNVTLSSTLVDVTENTDVYTLHNALPDTGAGAAELRVAAGKRIAVAAILSAAHTCELNIPGPGAVTSAPLSDELIINVAQTAGRIHISAPMININAMVKSGRGTLLLSGNNTYSGATIIQSGTLEVASAASLGDASVTNHIILSGGTLKSAGGVIDASNRRVILDGTGSFDPNGGAIHVQDIDGNGGLDRLTFQFGEVVARHVRVAEVHAKGVAQVGLGVAGNTSRIRQLTIDPGAQFDVTAGRLILVSGSFGDGSRIADVEVQIASGRKGALAAGGGLWQGSGIITSNADGLVTGLAVATAGDIGASTFGGLAVEEDDVLVMATYAADANLSGNVDADDYFQLDSSYNRPSSTATFFTGDFDFDGDRDGDDYFIIDTSFSGQGASLSPGAAPNGVAAVPEPAMLGIISLLPAALCRRRRRER